MSSKTRNSNIELLRLLCIVMIISMHIFGLHKDNLGTAGIAALSFNNAVCNMGVSIFILISGYYGIRFKADKLIDLVNIALFWSLALFAMDLDHSAKNVVRSIFPVFTGKYWFLTVYIIISCLAPYIDKMISQITKRQFMALIVVLGMFFVVAPSLLMLEIMHDSGKGVMNMLLVYLIGRYGTIWTTKTPHRIDRGGATCDNGGDWCGLCRYISLWNNISNVGSRQQYLYPSWSNNCLHNGND